MELYSVIELCKLHGIELRGDDGQPYCCGERMYVGSGLMGPDYARCQKCDKAIGNMTSPHINGGYIPPESFFEDHPDGKTWARIDSKM